MIIKVLTVTVKIPSKCWIRPVNSVSLQFLLKYCFNVSFDCFDLSIKMGYHPFKIQFALHVKLPKQPQTLAAMYM